MLLTILLVLSAGFHFEWAKSGLERDARENLNQQWAAVKGCLRIEYDANHDL